MNQTGSFIGGRGMGVRRFRLPALKLAWRATLEIAKRAREVGVVAEAERVGHLGDAHSANLQPLPGRVVQHPASDGAEAGVFLLQITVQGALADVEDGSQLGL